MVKSFSLSSALIAAVVTLSIIVTEVRPANAQSEYVESDLGSFVSYVCDRFPSTNLAQIIDDLLSQLQSLRDLLAQAGTNPGSIGDPSQCLPGFPAGLPALPGVGDFTACLDVSGFQGIGATIGSCLGGVLASFPDLKEYFSRLHWDLSAISQCLQALVVVPTISIPDLLAQLKQVLNNLIAILQSARIDLPVYDRFYSFFFDFCQHHYSPGAGIMSSTAPGYASTVSQTGGSLMLSTVIIGGSSMAAAVASTEAYAIVKGGGKSKKYIMSERAGKYERKISLSRRGKYAVSIYVMRGAIPEAVTRTSVKY